MSKVKKGILAILFQERNLFDSGLRGLNSLIFEGFGSMLSILRAADD